MIELKLCNVSKNGKMYLDYFLFSDKNFRDNDDIYYDFLTRLTVHDAVLIKGELERLERMPLILINDKNKTEEYLPKLISAIEEYFGKIEYRNAKNKREQAVKEYLQTNGVTI